MAFHMFGAEASHAAASQARAVLAIEAGRGEGPTRDPHAGGSAEPGPARAASQSTANSAGIQDAHAEASNPSRTSASSATRGSKLAAVVFVGLGTLAAYGAIRLRRAQVS